jgi:hypothetical protein
MQKEQQLGAGSDQQTLRAERDLALAEAALVAAETGNKTDRSEQKRSTCAILDDYGISIADAKTGGVEASHP